LTGSSDQIARQTLALYFEPERAVLPKQAEIDLSGLTQVLAFMGRVERSSRLCPARTVRGFAVSACRQRPV